jgi:hypothetical protein
MNYQEAKKILEEHGYKCSLRKDALRISYVLGGKERYVARLHGPVGKGQIDRLVTWIEHHAPKSDA